MGNRPAKAVSRRLLPRSAGPGAAAPGRVVSAEEVRRLQEKDEELVSQFREVTAELEEAEDERFRIVGSTEQRPLPKSRKVVEALEEEEIQKRSRLSGRVSPIGLVDILEQHRKGKDSTAIAAEFQRNTKEIQSIGKFI